jgi:hypothetical protein
VIGTKKHSVILSLGYSGSPRLRWHVCEPIRVPVDQSSVCTCDQPWYTFIMSRAIVMLVGTAI